MNAKQRRLARRRGDAITVRNCYNCYLMYSDKDKQCPECGHTHSERWTFGYKQRRTTK